GPDHGPGRVVGIGDEHQPGPLGGGGQDRLDIGDPLALGHLEREFLRPLLATLARVPACQDESARVEVVQRLRERLLLRDPQRARAPGILAYAGRGPLSAWLRVVAVREALGLQRRHRRERPTEADQLDALHDAAAGPELALLKQRSREAFREAFHDAVASLTPSERTLLRHYYLHGMGIDPLARILQIHRATVARRLARLRDTLLERTRERLRVTLGMQPEEFASVVRLIASRFDASVRRALGPDDDDQEPGDQVPHSS
ncbi:MAG: sigma-70 family RNA polymerase sigma factor, partial [Myxococcales bacterium]|nr:sigma-70 family RNA polymerase sigma factor [Myxococcales bacterium]